MKKTIFITIITIITIIFAINTNKTDSVFIEKVNLNLKDDEIAITFLNYETGKFLLISTTEENVLLVINANNIDELNSSLKIFNITQLNNLIVLEDISLDVVYDKKYLLDNFTYNDIKINKKETGIEITYGENIFNIYLLQSENIDGNFVYMLFEQKEHIQLGEDINIIFYVDTLEDRFVEETYSKWIDLYKVKEEEWATLKLKMDNYNMLTIPSYK